ncbi:hypothetical protein HaLaN_16430, partial [Haematococcus lacustris]
MTTAEEQALPKEPQQLEQELAAREQSLGAVQEHASDPPANAQLSTPGPPAAPAALRSPRATG